MADTETQTRRHEGRSRRRSRASSAPPALDMSWAKVPTERPPKPKIGAEGFTLQLADAGAYAWAPDHWPYQNDTPRGSCPSKDTGLPAPYTIYDKSEVWAENAADLYELAIREQWKPATQISWAHRAAAGSHRGVDRPDRLEHLGAAVQLEPGDDGLAQADLVRLSRGEAVPGDASVRPGAPRRGVPQARAGERRRARRADAGFFNRTVYASFKFTELIDLHEHHPYVVPARALRARRQIGRSQADRQLFELTANDLRRHLAYGIEHCAVTTC